VDVWFVRQAQSYTAYVAARVPECSLGGELKLHGMFQGSAKAEVSTDPSTSSFTAFTLHASTDYLPGFVLHSPTQQ
jgi:hypothetical protein